MYSPDLLSAEQTQTSAARADRHARGVSRDGEGFRPVALPALAAAMRGVSAARTSARTDRASLAARFEHEDTPLS